VGPSNTNPAPSAAICARVADHYRRKAQRTDGAFSSMCGIWADKAAAGHTNAFVRRVERMAIRSEAVA
jgi:hypothetical protein